MMQKPQSYFGLIRGTFLLCCDKPLIKTSSKISNMLLEEKKSVVTTATNTYAETMSPKERLGIKCTIFVNTLKRWYVEFFCLLTHSYRY